ncbi:MAG: hypothetical protein CL853_01395 [Crocinitomicaceae bacterium]|nr:hypothetical protein [Crocinitomicaceae bacterium]
MSFSLIILAGGKSSRMGTDKGLLSFKGKPMIQHVIDNLASKFQETIIVSNNKNYDQFKKIRVADNHTSIGPLGGIEAGLFASSTINNIIVSCDSPFTSIDLTNFIVEHHKHKDVIFLENNGLHPFPGFYHKRILPKIKAMIDKQDYKIANLKNYCRVQNLDCSGFDEKYFINFNSTDQIEKFNANPS